MPRKATWTNQDGLVVGFSTHTTDDGIPAVSSSVNGIKTATVRIGYQDLVAAGTAWTAADGAPQAIVLKRGTRILSAHFTTKTAFATLTALVVGTWGIKNRQYDITEAVDDEDGIITATEGAAANLTPAGKVITANGALVAVSSNVGASVGSTSNSDCVIQYVYTGTAPTAGDGILVVSYIEPPYSVVEG